MHLSPIYIFEISENPRTVFAGEKRAREEYEEEEGMENYHRKRHEWLFEVVSGSGGWQSGQPYINEQYFYLNSSPITKCILSRMSIEKKLTEIRKLRVN